jgi:hypothetical protein
MITAGFGYLKNKLGRNECCLTKKYFKEIWATVIISFREETLVIVAPSVAYAESMAPTHPSTSSPH